MIHIKLPKKDINNQDSVHSDTFSPDFCKFPTLSSIYSNPSCVFFLFSAFAVGLKNTDSLASNFPDNFFLSPAYRKRREPNLIDEQHPSSLLNWFFI